MYSECLLLLSRDAACCVPTKDILVFFGSVDYVNQCPSPPIFWRRGDGGLPQLLILLLRLQCRPLLPHLSALALL